MIVTMKRVLSLSAVAVLVAACAHYSLVGPGSVKVADAYSVDTPIAWNEASQGKVRTWTVDGPQLQRLTFVGGLEDGDPLFEVEGDKEKTMPRFHSTMTPLEIKELIEAGLRVSGANQLETYDVRPQAFGSIQGFRFDFSYDLESGLENEGTALAAKKDGKLYVILYTGTRFYYYGKHKDDVERLISSIRML